MPETAAAEVFGDVRYNAILFMLGALCIGLAFVFLLTTFILAFAQGGSVSSLSTEYALLLTLAAALGGVGFIALGLGAVIFSLNYEPIRQEAQLVALSAIPYGAFLVAIHFARVRLGGTSDFFEYAVQRDATGTPTLILALPETFGALGPYMILGTLAFAICCFGLSLFMGNMKIVKDVGGWTLGITRTVGAVALLGQVLLYAGWAAFAAETGTSEWLTLPFALYLLGYFTVALLVPLLGAIMAFRMGAIFWDAAKTVRYLSDFRKRAQTAAAARAKTAVDDRPWWEKIADEKDEK